MKKTNYKNHMRLEVLSKDSNVFLVCYSMARFIQELNWSKETTNEFLTAVEEAVTNCMLHAYPETTGVITIIASITGKKVRVVIKDSGVGITNLEQAIQPLYTTANPARSGMGFTIMQTFSSTFDVKSFPGKGTRVILTREEK